INSIRRNRRLKQISAPRHGLDQLVIIVAELLAQFPDALHKRVVTHGNVGPHLLKQLSLGHKSPSIVREAAQHLERLGPQVDLLIAGSQTWPRYIEDKAVKPQDPVDDLVQSALPARVIVGLIGNL